MTSHAVSGVILIEWNRIEYNTIAALSWSQIGKLHNYATTDDAFGCNIMPASNRTISVGLSRPVGLLCTRALISPRRRWRSGAGGSPETDGDLRASVHAALTAVLSKMDWHVHSYWKRMWLCGWAFGRQEHWQTFFATVHQDYAWWGSLPYKVLLAISHIYMDVQMFTLKRVLELYFHTLAVSLYIPHNCLRSVIRLASRTSSLLKKETALDLLSDSFHFLGCDEP